MAAKIFISYRRDDSAGHTGRLTDRLAGEFGQDLLFMDVDGIPLGMNFVKVLQEQVTKCAVLLAVIGPNWLEARDEDGNRRLEDPSDFVRVEIATALKRDIPVIPILLDGAGIPKAKQLPEDLKELALRNGLNVRHASFHADMERLIRGLKEQLVPASAPALDDQEDAHQAKDEPEHEQDTAFDQYLLANRYLIGFGGVEQDEREAVRLFRLAADQNDPFAQVKLADCYREGRGGLPKDEREAIRLYRLAADQNDPFAQVKLAEAYSVGIGACRRTSARRCASTASPPTRKTLPR